MRAEGPPISRWAFYQPGEILLRAIAAPRLRIGFPFGLGGFSDRWRSLMQRRQERYASMGPNCPSGHPWSENARFNYRGYRFCIGCTELKAEARRNDPTTYTGKCPKGHAYTQENTLIVTSQNSKVCLICKRAASARARVVDVDLIPKILDLARQGMTINALLARGPRRLDKALAANSVTLTRLTTLKTPEGRELKQLFAQNAKMAHAMRYGVNAWLPNRREFLAAQLAKSSDVTEVTTALNDHFGSSHSERNVQLRAWKWRLKFGQKPSIIVAAPIGLRLPPGSLMERLVAMLPKNLAPDHRDDLISDIAMLVFEGRVPEANLEANVRLLVRRSFKTDHNPWGDVSLDAPVFADSTTKLGDTVTTGLWQSESRWQ